MRLVRYRPSSAENALRGLSCLQRCAELPGGIGKIPAMLPILGLVAAAVQIGAPRESYWNRGA